MGCDYFEFFTTLAAILKSLCYNASPQEALEFVRVHSGDRGPYSWNYDPICRMRYTMRDEKCYSWVHIACDIDCRIRQLSNGLSRGIWPSRDMNVACGNLVPREISKVMFLWRLKAAQNKKHVNRDSHIASSPIS